MRRDPLIGRWVLVAPERSRRPNDFRSSGGLISPCPFCPGHEAETPPEVFAVREPGTPRDAPGWKIRVVPNKYPAVAPHGRARRPAGGFFESRAGLGAHEVVIDSPAHDLEFPDLPPESVRNVLEIYRQRVESLEAGTGTAYVQLFKNKGREAGATLRHPHAQIVSLPLLPQCLREDIDASGRFFKKTGGCLHCRIGEEEEKAGERIVARNDGFLAFVPFAARFPYEIRLLPRRHEARFSGTSGEEIAALADILGRVLRSVKSLLEDPSYNLVLHQGPAPAARTEAGNARAASLHWYLEIIPVTTRVAGFEWGTGFHINPVLPEAAARRLRV